MRIAAINRGIPRRKQPAQLFQGVFRRRAMGQHDPDRAGCAECRDQPGQIRDTHRTFGGKGGHGGGILVPDHGAVPRLHQPPRDVPAHAAQTDNADFHGFAPLRPKPRARDQ